jgi:hypothetical protein
MGARTAAGGRTRTGLGALAVVATLLLAGCSALLEAAPTPTPQPFPGIAGELGRVGVDVSRWASGDAGCDDPTLSPTAIRFEAAGLDQETPVHVRIYIFRSREAWERRSADVESCVAAWATDPGTFELLQISPYVVAGQGPWPPEFDKAMREGITAAAGTGD